MKITGYRTEAYLMRMDRLIGDANLPEGVDLMPGSVLFLETEVQASLGDRSPAVTVGQMLQLRPEAVRQQHGRVRKRLQALAASDPYFADLADLAIVA